jgi:hypothetical protein
MEASSIDPTSRRLDLRSQLLETTKPPAKVNESARIITVMDCVRLARIRAWHGIDTGGSGSFGKDLKRSFRDRCTGRDPRALPGAGLDFIFTADQMDSFAHADEAQSRREPRTLNIEPNAVVGYFQAEFMVRTSQANRHAGRAAMLHCIMRCFLQDPEKSQCDHAVQFFLKMIAGTVNRDT